MTKSGEKGVRKPSQFYAAAEREVDQLLALYGVREKESVDPA